MPVVCYVGQCDELDDSVVVEVEETSSSSSRGQSLLRITTADQWREVDQYNAMVVLDDEDDDGEEEEDDEDEEGDIT